MREEEREEGGGVKGRKGKGGREKGGEGGDQLVCRREREMMPWVVFLSRLTHAHTHTHTHTHHANRIYQNPI